MRTVIVKGLDSWVKRQDVIKHMSMYGHIVSIDFPMIDGEVKKKVDEILDQQSNSNGISSLQTKGDRERKIYEFLKRADEEEVQNEDDLTGKVGSLEHLKGVEDFLSKLMNKKENAKIETEAKENNNIKQKQIENEKQLNMSEMMKNQQHSINKFNNVLNQLGSEKLENLVSALKPINQLFQKVQEVSKFTQKQREISKISKVQQDQLAKFYKTINSFLGETPSSQKSQNPSAELLQLFNIKQPNNTDKTHQNLSQIQKNEQISVFSSILLQLEKQSNLLKSKMQNLLKNYGVMDKVLVAIPDSNKDPDKLPKHIPHPAQQILMPNTDKLNAFYNHLRVQELLTIDQQRVMIQRFKNISPAQRYQQILRFKDSEKNQLIGGLSRVSPNFERKLAIQLLLKKPFFQVERETKDKAGFQSNIAGFKGREWKARKNDIRIGSINVHQVYNKMLRQGLDQYSLPLDALYQKEKQVIHNYANAASDLRSKRLDEQDNRFLRCYMLNDQVRKERDYLKRKDKKMMDQIRNESLKNYNRDTKVVNLQSISPQQAAHKLLCLKEGISALEDRVAYNNQRRAVNKGYCFVTFASSDQARIAVMANQTNIISSLLPISDTLVSKIKVQPKKDKTHSDLDELYRMSMIIRDSKLNSEMARLRLAKRNLQKVEKEVQRRDRAGNVLDQGKSHQNMTRGNQDNPITSPYQELQSW